MSIRALDVLLFVRAMGRARRKTPTGRPKGAAPEEGEKRRGFSAASRADPYIKMLGARLRDLRLERGLSLVELQRTGGVTPSQMSSVERGLALVTAGTLSSVSKAIDYPPFVAMAIPEMDAISAVLEEIRQAYDGDLRRAAADIQKSARYDSIRRRAARMKAAKRSR